MTETEAVQFLKEVYSEALSILEQEAYHNNFKVSISRALIYLFVFGLDYIPFKEGFNQEDINTFFAFTLCTISVISHLLVFYVPKTSDMLQISGYIYMIVIIICLSILSQTTEIANEFELPFPIRLHLIGLIVFDLVSAVEYKIFKTNKHWLVYGPLIIISWLVYVFVNLKYQMWDYLAILFGTYSLSLIARILTAIRVQRGHDRRLLEFPYAGCLFIMHFFIPIGFLLLFVLVIMYLLILLFCNFTFCLCLPGECVCKVFEGPNCLRLLKNYTILKYICGDEQEENMQSGE